jgi:hypothetical protein
MGYLDGLCTGKSCLRVASGLTVESSVSGLELAMGNGWTVGQTGRGELVERLSECLTHCPLWDPIIQTKWATVRTKDEEKYCQDIPRIIDFQKKQTIEFNDAEGQTPDSDFSSVHV